MGVRVSRSALTARPYGETAQLLDRYAWYGNSSKQVCMSPVGSLLPNDFGMFDMLGNAVEWCQERPLAYGTDQPYLEDQEQLFRLDDRESRAVRGGSYYIPHSTCGPATAATTSQ